MKLVKKTFVCLCFSSFCAEAMKEKCRSCVCVFFTKAEETQANNIISILCNKFNLGHCFLVDKDRNNGEQLRENKWGLIN